MAPRGREKSALSSAVSPFSPSFFSFSIPFSLSICPSFRLSFLRRISSLCLAPAELVGHNSCSSSVAHRHLSRKFAFTTSCCLVLFDFFLVWPSYLKLRNRAPPPPSPEIGAMYSDH